MTKRRFLLFAAFVGSFCISLASYAEIPKQLSYYGKLLDADGRPLAGMHAITFRIYDDEAQGEKVWEETQEVKVEKGIFQVLLGTKEPFVIRFDRPLWFSVEVNQDGEMVPRIPIVSVAYAVNAAYLDSLDPNKFLRVDKGGAIEGPLFVKGPIESQGKRVMTWDRGLLLFVVLLSLSGGALAGAFIFLLSRFVATRVKK